MNTKNILLEQMHACHDKTNWFVTADTAVEGLTAEQAAWKQTGMSNSIRQIVYHLVFWNRRYLNRFKGIPDPEFSGDNDETFGTGDGTDADWNAAVKELNDVMSEWESAISETDQGNLESKLNNDPEGTWAYYIALINVHTAYHVGQIVTLRKSQGSWDKSKGVN